jgi:hypothetical protein
MEINPFSGQEIVTNITYNMSQFLQLKHDIAASQNEALIAGLVIGCIIGFLGAIVGMWRYRMG